MVGLLCTLRRKEGRKEGGERKGSVGSEMVCDAAGQDSKEGRAEMRPEGGDFSPLPPFLLKTIFVRGK